MRPSTIILNGWLSPWAISIICHILYLNGIRKVCHIDSKHGKVHAVLLFQKELKLVQVHCNIELITHPTQQKITLNFFM